MTVQGPNTQPETGDLTREHGTTDEFSEQDLQTISQRLGSLALEETTVYRDHQREAFDDVVAFFAGGGKETYVLQPTGTGKTVLFVELSRLLIESAARNNQRSRVIVLEPNIDLVEQTVGWTDPDTNELKGFRGFAPDLETHGYHSKKYSKTKQKGLRDADVLVTTYNTFRNMIDSFIEAETHSISEWKEEQQRHRTTISENAVKIPRLKALHAQLLNAYYTRQEVAFARSETAAMLKNEASEKLHPADLRDLQTLSSLLNPETQHSDEYYLRETRREIARMIRERPHIKTKLRAQRERFGKRRNRTAAANNAFEELIGIDDEEDEISSHGIESLNKFEQFIFLFAVKRSRKSEITSGNIHSRRERDELYALSDEIKALRSGSEFANSRIGAIDKMLEVREAIQHFELIVCDEVHRSIGEQTWEAIRSYAERKNIAILGVTASDEYEDRKLVNYFESRAHELTKHEAIERNLINPISLFVHETNREYHNVEIDASGDYSPVSLRELRFDTDRNKKIAEYAKLLSGHGYRGLVSAIPGDEGEHAMELERLINRQMIVDPVTGEERYLRAVTVIQATKNRQQIYRDLDQGKIDWITYVDIAREGLDIPHAKALINGRPTRSKLLVIQRTGRIDRIYEDAPVSVVIDLLDTIIADEETTILPPVLAADIYGLDSVKQGHIVGDAPNKDIPVITALQAKMPGTITAHNTRFKKLFANMPTYDARGISNHGDQALPTSDMQTFEAIRKSYRGFLPKEILLEALAQDEPAVRAIRGRKGTSTQLLFSVSDVEKLHADKPEINPWKLFVDPDGQRWITPEGCIKLLSKSFPRLTPEEVSDAIRQIEEETDRPFNKEIGRVRLHADRSNRKLGFIHMFKLEEITRRLVPYLQAQKER